MASELGILAIWNNCAPGHEDEYEHWYQTEHLPERLAIPGFLRGRRYETLGAGPRFFTYYETASPAVLGSAAYLERGNNPTPATTRIMTGPFKDMNRTVCRQVVRLGDMRGAVAATIRMKAPPPQGLVQGWLDSLRSLPRLARVELWHAEQPSVPRSNEERLRGADQNIGACLLVEALRELECRDALARLDLTNGSEGVEVGLFRLMCELCSGS